MRPRREQVWVGLFVLAAAALLITAVLSVAGAFNRGGVPHRAFFEFAGGLEPGAVVRFGGMKAGSVRAIHVDPEDSTRIEIDFRIRRDIPLKADSVAEITSLGALGDNYLELTTGTRDAKAAAPGSVVKSAETFTFEDIGNMAAALQPMVHQVLQKLNQRLDELHVTVARANDLMNDRNRANVSRSLANLNGMLAEDRPKLSATLGNVQTASARITPVLNEFKKTMAQANDTLDLLDAVVKENRQGLRGSIAELERTLLTASSVMDQLNQTLENNSDNIDDILENVRAATQNLKELTETLKNRPYTLIRADRSRERKPGQN
jgi:phospholipid/cholesterol/gamma-HCH transport system substrate-binding protein